MNNKVNTYRNHFFNTKIFKQASVILKERYDYIFNDWVFTPYITKYILNIIGHIAVYISIINNFERRLTTCTCIYKCVFKMHFMYIVSWQSVHEGLATKLKIFKFGVRSNQSYLYFIKISCSLINVLSLKNSKCNSF